MSDGVDPDTGEQYPPDSQYQMPDTVRALILAITALEKQQQNLPGSTGKPWNDEEDNRLLEAYHTGTRINEISELHGRTVGTIKSSLVKHERIKNS